MDEESEETEVEIEFIIDPASQAHVVAMALWDAQQELAFLIDWAEEDEDEDLEFLRAAQQKLSDISNVLLPPGQPSGGYPESGKVINLEAEIARRRV